MKYLIYLLICYLVRSFAIWNLNVNTWSQSDRMGLMFMYLIVLVVDMIIEHKKTKK